MTLRHGWQNIIFFLVTALASTALSAQPDFSNFKLNAYPVFAIGGGVAYATQGIGQSQFFPIHNPNTDQFYNYAANSSEQTQYLFNAYLGNEWMLPRNFAAQLGVDFTQNTHFNGGGVLTQGADVHSQSQANYSFDIVTRQLLLEGRLYYHYSLMHPYVLLGAGWAFNSATNYSTTFPFNLTFTRDYNSHYTSAFSYSVGVGVEFQLATSVRLGVGYRYANLGTSSLGKSSVNSIPVGGTLSSKPHIYANELMAQLTFYPFDDSKPWDQY